MSNAKKAPVSKKIKRPIKIAETNLGLVTKVSKSQLRGFMDFIRTQGVVGLAIGLVLGSAVSVLVKSLIDNIVMPPIGLVLGSAEGLKGLSLTIGSTSDGKIATLSYGIFLNDFINFIIIALVVYFVVKLLKFDKLDKKKE
ncbi:MAG: large conductance mechanosensitive channel [Patescibacteria group bacterium]|nr:large conductance mechanosensitive channel [Patescibacteria group bacterium]